MTTAAKKTAAPRKRAVSGAEGKGPSTTTVITTEGTSVVPVGPVDAKTLEEKKDEEVVEALSHGGFNDLTADELRAVADHFIKDYEEGAGKKELLAALASGDEDDEPVTWAQYEEYYVPTLPPASAGTPDRPAGNPFEVKTAVVEEVIVADEIEENDVLVKMERKNPRFDIAGYTFTKEHPFNSVPEKTAEFIAKQPGFRRAMPSEVQDYYN